MAELTPDELSDLEYDWRFWGRPDQFAPEGDWDTWLALAGRGWGKTEAGAQWIRQRVKDGARRIALIAETQKDLEEVMVARLIAIYPPHQAPKVRYKPVRIVWPDGAEALGYNGTEPDQLRGPEFDTAWVDELAKYRYARDTWDMLQFTMRRTDPRVCVTTTPKPIPVIREILANHRTRTTRGSTFQNAGNLSAQFIDKIKARYEGTRLGRQELNAEMLDDVEGAMITRDMIEAARVSKNQVPIMRRIVVAIDPSGCSGPEDQRSDEIGIVVCGEDGLGNGYVLEDRSGRYSPEGWGREAVKALDFWQADRIIGERNFGGAMVESTIRSVRESAPVKLVTASRGKMQRAEPIAALYEQNRVKHYGAFPELEDQICSFSLAGYQGERSPDRADALVWALSELLLEDKPRLAFA